MILTEITEEKIEQNWEKFKSLLLSIKREGMQDLINYLENDTDFKYAPASTRFHGAFKGGLCEHSLTVYNLICQLNNTYKDQLGEEPLNEDSLKIAALLHDIAKINTYELSYQNKKVYKESGTKHDNLGNFEWESIPVYKTRDVEDRFVFVNHESTSEFICRQFIGLTISESTAIMTHHGGLGFDSIRPEAMGVNYSRCPLAVLLHAADLMAAYIKV